MMKRLEWTRAGVVVVVKSWGIEAGYYLSLLPKTFIKTNDNSVALNLAAHCKFVGFE